MTTYSLDSPEPPDAPRDVRELTPRELAQAGGAGNRGFVIFEGVLPPPKPSP